MNTSKIVQSIEWFGVGALATWFLMILSPPLALAFAIFVHKFFPTIVYSDTWWIVGAIAIGLVIGDWIRMLIGNQLTIIILVCVAFIVLM